MPKSAWEARVGMLLSPPDFPYSFKPYDSGMYGGQPRLDWLACDLTGVFWAIEAKMLPANRKTFRLDTLVSAGQAQALDAVATCVCSVALLAVGRGTELYFYDWRKIQWLLGATAPPALTFTTDPMFSFPWTGPKLWATRSLYETYRSKLNDPTGVLSGVLFGPSSLLPPASPPTPTPSELASQGTPPDPSPSTLRHAGFTRTLRRKLLSEL
jgi:hypothetical protein